MKIRVAWVSKTGKTKDPAIQSLTDDYLKRISHYAQVEGTAVKDEAALLHPAKASAKPQLVLLDSRGKQLSSEELAKFIEDHLQRGSSVLMFAIGPADGFSDEARSGANLVLSLGKMTLSHEIARIVLLEQLYRAFTILKGHPYHLGHV